LEEYKSHPSFKNSYLKKNALETKVGLNNSAIEENFMNGQKVRATSYRSKSKRNFITFSTLIDSNKWQLDNKFLQTFKKENIPQIEPLNPLTDQQRQISKLR
jgi:hypothetical protein